MKSVHWEPDEMPNREQWLQLKNILKRHPAKWMIWEGNPVKTSLDGLKSLGVASLVFDPCGSTLRRVIFLPSCERIWRI
jgi:zinc transport system substrate-binding protein